MKSEIQICETYKSLENTLDKLICKKKIENRSEWLTYLMRKNISIYMQNCLFRQRRTEICAQCLFKEWKKD